jgi:hypothetical protein
MFTVLSWFCFIGAMVCSPALAGMGAGLQGMKFGDRNQVLGLAAFAIAGAFCGLKGIRNDERGRSWAKLGMFANLLAVLLVAGLEAKARWS